MGSEKIRKAPGCHITKEDYPNIIVSFICFAVFLVYGASAAILGAALPAMADDFSRSKAQFGIAFTSRGIGYFLGTVLSGFMYSDDKYSLNLSKELSTTLSLVLTGLSCGVIDISNNFIVVIIAFAFQGVGFGFIDTLANCVLPEKWGKRNQPWMQGLHSCFGMGAIMGPSLVGGLGYRQTYIIVFFVSFLPLAVLIFYKNIHLFFDQNDHKVLDQRDEDDLNEDTEGSSKEHDEKPQIQAPFWFKLVVAFFFLIYVGVETGFAGWIPTYSLQVGIAKGNSDSAYLSSIFWAALTLGRVLAIPTAIVLTATAMIRTLLTLSFFSTLLALFILSNSYHSAAIVCGFLGFSLSAIFPIMMTVYGDYNFVMDSNTTAMFVIGATIGESLIPVVIGVIMSITSPNSLPISVFVFTLILVFLYIFIHFYGEYSASAFFHQDHQLVDSSEHNNPLNNQVFTIEDPEDEIEMTTIEFKNSA